jgi:GTPase SAR1 family protein
LAGVFLVADISNPESLDPISTIYIPELDKFLPKNSPRMLILAKCDLSSKIPEEKINVFMKKTNIQDIFYVSAKIGDNIDAPFREMVKRLTLTRIHQNLQNMT